MRRSSLARLVVLAALGGFVTLTLATRPPLPQRLSVSRDGQRTDVAGAYHVHSVRSDGTGTPDDIARAAADAGLKFVILTDHGDGTRTPESPQYLHGVLVIDAVEISTAGGHYVALGMGASPYRLAGEPRDVVEDVKRLGGFGIVAHPGSLKPELRWQQWDLGFDGVEWLNADSEWRDERARAIVWALWHYPMRPSASITSLLDRPAEVFTEWDRVTRRRRVVALAAVDAHARLGRLGNLASHDEPGAAILAVPSYEAAFGTFSVRVRLTSPWQGSAERDASLLIDAIRQGHLYSAIDAIAKPGRFEFRAQSGANRAGMGDQLLTDGPVDLTVDADLPKGAQVVLIQNGRTVKTGRQRDLKHRVNRPATFRVEVRVPGAPGIPAVPWIVSNPIYGVASLDLAPPRAVAAERRPIRLRTARSAVEHDPSSSIAAVRDSADGVQRVRMEYQLGGGARQSQFVALVIPVNRVPAGTDHLSFGAHADRPQRISVQFRSEAGERWQRSVYVDSTVRSLSVELDDVSRAAEAAEIGRPPLDQVRAVLFVVDTVNSAPGATGTVTIEAPRFAR